MKQEMETETETCGMVMEIQSAFAFVAIGWWYLFPASVGAWRQLTSSGTYGPCAMPNLLAYASCVRPLKGQPCNGERHADIDDNICHSLPAQVGITLRAQLTWQFCCINNCIAYLSVSALRTARHQKYNTNEGFNCSLANCKHYLFGGTNYHNLDHHAPPIRAYGIQALSDTYGARWPREDVAKNAPGAATPIGLETKEPARHDNEPMHTAPAHATRSPTSRAPPAM